MDKTPPNTDRPHRRARPEQDLQKALVQHLTRRGVKGLVFWHTPMGMFAGGRRNRKGIAIQGAIMQGLGARAGVSDLILVCDAKIHALELKAPGGRATASQVEFLADMQKAGAHCAIAEGLDQALQQLEEWHLLKGKTV
jgi:hypothetical protein